jgi:hypothetical protein
MLLTLLCLPSAYRRYSCWLVATVEFGASTIHQALCPVPDAAKIVQGLFQLAEAVRFELTDGCPSPVFKTGAIDHSATLPALHH